MLLRVSALAEKLMIAATAKKNVQKCFWLAKQSQKSVLKSVSIEKKVKIMSGIKSSRSQNTRS